MKTISIDDILLFHKKLISTSGGLQGIRDKGIIESAINRGNQTFNGEDLYPGILDKISAITYSLINNHGFIDGNKRIGIAVMLLLLKLNKIKLQYSQVELVELGLNIAKSLYKENNIKNWIIEHKII